MITSTSKNILAALLALGALATAPVRADTIEVALTGLNCALCTESMKGKLMTLVGAKDIEPRLECGFLYFEVEKGATVSAAALKPTLLSNGFTLDGIKPSPKSMSQVRATEAC